MALRTMVVLVRSDALLDIGQDPEFTKKLVSGIIISLNHDIPVDIPTTGFSNAATVVGPHIEGEDRD